MWNSLWQLHVWLGFCGGVAQTLSGDTDANQSSGTRLTFSLLVRGKSFILKIVSLLCFIWIKWGKMRQIEFYQRKALFLYFLIFGKLCHLNRPVIMPFCPSYPPKNSASHGISCSWAKAENSNYLHVVHLRGVPDFNKILLVIGSKKVFYWCHFHAKI